MDWARAEIPGVGKGLMAREGETESCGRWGPGFTPKALYRAGRASHVSDATRNKLMGREDLLVLGGARIVILEGVRKVQ